MSIHHLALAIRPFHGKSEARGQWASESKGGDVYSGLGGCGRLWKVKSFGPSSSDASAHGTRDTIVDCQNGMLKSLSGIGWYRYMLEQQRSGNDVGREALAMFGQS